jgi:hypothetical protein
MWWMPSSISNFLSDCFFELKSQISAYDRLYASPKPADLRSLLISFCAQLVQLLIVVTEECSIENMVVVSATVEEADELELEECSMSCAADGLIIRRRWGRFELPADHEQVWIYLNIEEDEDPSSVDSRNRDRDPFVRDFCSCELHLLHGLEADCNG